MALERQVFLGVDQTGAVDRSGVPVPLPGCVLRGTEVTFLYLKSFTKDQITEALAPTVSEGVLVCVDCVLGLPESVGTSWREALQLIQNSQGYGRKVASTFFSTLGRGQKPRRAVEILCNANSVFNEKPFQKNIQTGTYRIWKDISEQPEDFWVPALEQVSSETSIPIFEGYPTLSWKLNFKVKSRRPNELQKLIKAEKLEVDWTPGHQARVNEDPNLADAFVLALTLKKLSDSALDMAPNKEGWILGFTGS